MDFKAKIESTLPINMIMSSGCEVWLTKLLLFVVLYVITVTLLYLLIALLHNLYNTVNFELYVYYKINSSVIIVSLSYSIMYKKWIMFN